MSAKPMDDGDYKIDRFLVLRRWFGAIGCCWNCQDTLAFAQIDRENGAPPGAVIDLSDCRHLDQGERCRGRANANRKAMPARP